MLISLKQLYHVILVTRSLPVELQSSQVSGIGREKHVSESFLTLTRKTKISDAFLVISYVLNGVAKWSMEKRLTLLLPKKILGSRESSKIKVEGFLFINVLLVSLRFIEYLSQ